MLLAAAIFAPIFCSWSAIGVFVVATGATLLLGHSVG
jgi:stearoyl-CoA desaturase (delta-9 desaturase)